MVGPTRGTKAYREEYVTVIYGINPRKKRVQAVYAGRDRVLSGDNDDGTRFATS